MLHNNNYYNNYIPHNGMYYRPAPIYPNIETQPINDNNKTTSNTNVIDDEINIETQEIISEPSTSNKDRLSLFGLSLNIDDIIIIGIAIFLFMENKKDYLLLIILGLLLFDISLDTFKNMNIFKRLFDPT